MSKVERVFGLHACEAVISNHRNRISNVWIDKNSKNSRLLQLCQQYRQKLQLTKVEREQLEGLVDSKRHQGIVIEIILPRENNEKDLQKLVQEIQGNPCFIILDQVKDPHNLGASMRCADATGVNGIIVPKDQSVGMTSTVYKVASGAAESVPLFKVANLARIIRWMKTQGIWIIGSDPEADQVVFDSDLTVPLALAFGAEEKGLRRLTRDLCDIVVKFPMVGNVKSLNLSVSVGVMLYEMTRQRRYQSKS